MTIRQQKTACRDLESPTRILQLLQELVMGSPQLCPLRELILTAGRVEVAPRLQELLLELLLLRRQFRRLDGEVVEQSP